MSGGVVKKEPAIILAPVPDARDYTLSAEIWGTLMEEIDNVTGRIAAGEELVPEDVARVRALKKQVDSYLTAFNKACKASQDKYKKLVEQQLNSFGYPVIEQYIDKKRKEQANNQTLKIAEKQKQLHSIIKERVDATYALKDTALAGNLFSAFTYRFPNVNSAAKDKEINNWEPYKSVIDSTIMVLDVFFTDPSYAGAMQLPITSATMQCLLSYVRDGNANRLLTIGGQFAKDAGILKNTRLRQEIKDKGTALTRIKGIMEQELPVDEKIRGIADIIRIAETL